MTQNWEECIALDQCGFFPAPGEGAEAFQQRVSALLKFRDDIFKSLKENGKYELEGLLYKEDEILNRTDLLHYQNQSKDKYQFHLDYVPAFYSSRGLNFLFGGMAISFEDTENKYKKGEMFSIFQLRKYFRSKEKFLIYTRNEIISHEACHVARAPLRAVEFEEYFAYQTSDSAFRRLVSPMLWHGYDMVVLMLLLVVVLCGQVYTTFFSKEMVGYFYSWVPFILYLSFLSVRSFRSRKQLSSLRKKILPFCQKMEWVDAVLFRLTDEEIKAAAKAKDLKTYLTEQNDLRWQIIKARFLQL